MQFDDGDLNVVKEETIRNRIQLQGIAHARWAVYLSIAVIAAYALWGLIVLVWAFAVKREAPAWAAAVESSTITAALAVIFKNHLPAAPASGHGAE